MSLTRKREMTAKNLAAHRLNGRRSRGPATLAGKARAAGANLRHGLYSRAQGEALLALGEDPDDYARLQQSLFNDLQPRKGLESQLVLRMARALWRMQRSERMQDGLALKRLQSGIESEDLLAGTRFARAHRTWELLSGLAKALHRPDHIPSAAEVRDFAASLGSDRSPETQKAYLLLRSLTQAQGGPGPTQQIAGSEPIQPPAEAREREAARQELLTLLDELIRTYRNAWSLLLEQCDNVRSPQNRAALMAPQDENALLMQRMEDSSLRHLWRLTNVLIRVRSGALTPRDVKNAGRSG
jgi:hypothetical protein